MRISAAALPAADHQVPSMATKMRLIPASPCDILPMSLGLAAPSDGTPAMSKRSEIGEKTQVAAAASGGAVGFVVSSAHLAEGASPALSEFEFGLILLSHAFHRWMTRCADAAGFVDLSPLDVLVLHTVNH